MCVEYAVICQAKRQLINICNSNNSNSVDDDNNINNSNINNEVYINNEEVFRARFSLRGSAFRFVMGETISRSSFDWLAGHWRLAGCYAGWLAGWLAGGVSDRTRELRVQ